MQQKENVVYQKETIYFILCLLISIPIYLIAAVSIIGLIIVAALILISFIANAIFIGSIRGNGVRLNDEQFPIEYNRIKELSTAMGLKQVPDVFIVQSEGMLNAFATRFFGRNMVVLYSEVFDLARQQGEKELEFIIAHELAHVKRRHVLKHWLILPAMWMPFLGEAYLRAAEYTCDRHAAAFIEDGQAAKSALKILAVGKLVHVELNEDAYLRQIQEESNPFVWLAEKLSSHPTLPKRIQHIGQFMALDDTPGYMPNHAKIVLNVLLLFIGFAVVWTGAVFGMTYLITKVDFSNYFEEPILSSDDGYELTDQESLGETELMSAAWYNDVDAVRSLLESGVEIEEVDKEGSPALHYAVYADSKEALKLLLSAGADPNSEDDFGNVPLLIAFEYDVYEIAQLLLEYGADPDLKSTDGVSVRELALSYGDERFIDLLEQY